MTFPAYFFLGALSLMLVVAMVTDLRSRIIPNLLNILIALAALGWWLAMGFSGEQVVVQLVMATIVLILFAAAYAIGMMGGGDVKLLAALALWFSLAQFLTILVWMAIGGGALTLAMIVQHRLRKLPGRPEIPYGVAIAGAALLVLTNDILTTAAA